MGEVPVGQLDKALKQLFNEFASGLPDNIDDIEAYVASYKTKVQKTINTLGGEIAHNGAVLGFPAPHEIDLDDKTSPIFDSMAKTLVQQGIASGMHSTADISKAMKLAGVAGKQHELERLARTEVVRAYWKNTWDSVDGLDLVLVWSSDYFNRKGRTCTPCINKDGLVVESESVRDHPNGRCTLAPSFPEDVGLRKKSPSPGFSRTQSLMPVPTGIDIIDEKTCNGLASALGHTMLQRGISGMVSQGWTSGEGAAIFMQDSDFKDLPVLSRQQHSNLMRTLENLAEELWLELRQENLPKTVYRGGTLNGVRETGLVSWSTSFNSAMDYTGGRGPVHKVRVPEGIYGYPYKTNGGRSECMFLGKAKLDSTPHTTRGGVTMTTGSLDHYTTLIEPY